MLTANGNPNQYVGKIDFTQPSPLQSGGQIQYAPFPQFVTIPMSETNWKRLSRETQLRILEELGILAMQGNG